MTAALVILVATLSTTPWADASARGNTTAIDQIATGFVLEREDGW